MNGIRRALEIKPGTSLDTVTSAKIQPIAIWSNEQTFAASNCKGSRAIQSLWRGLKCWNQLDEFLYCRLPNVNHVVSAYHHRDRIKEVKSCQRLERHNAINQSYQLHVQRWPFLWGTRRSHPWESPLRPSW